MRLPRPAVLGAMARMDCVESEHTQGVYSPSERTGTGGGVCGLIVIVATLGVLAWRAPQTRRAAIWKTCAGTLLLLALVGAAATAVYFEWVLGGLSERMETFTRATLEARSVPRLEAEAFVESVRASWVWTSTLANTFALYFVWGGLFGGGVAAAVRAMAHLSKFGVRTPPHEPR